jgi:hypothetical protein
LTVFLAGPFAFASSAAADHHEMKADAAHAGHEHDMQEGGMVGATPGPEHAHLQKMVGKWKATNKMMMGEGAAPMVCEGTEDVMSICNGMFISTTYKSGAPMPFEGHGVEGYDTHKKKYVGTWVDTMGSAVYSYEGTMDAKGVMTYTMTGPDPATGQPTTSTMVCEMKDNNTRTMKMFMGTDTKAAPMMEITYTRM